MVVGTPNIWAFVPGLLLIGLGLGMMLTPAATIRAASDHALGS
jgi:hypothetical protein